MNPYVVFGIGLSAQLLFSARLLVQWVLSERARRVLSPVLFWQLSMAASFLLCLYGWLRNDFAILAGQFVSYYIYIWNLKVQGAWEKTALVVRRAVCWMPAAAAGWFLADWRHTVPHLFVQAHIPLWLIVFGTMGQFTFTLRFVYQWWYSYRLRRSVLPLNFWVLSLVGSSMIIVYALIRHDPVLVLGQAAGMLVYARNVYLSVKTVSGT